MLPVTSVRADQVLIHHDSNRTLTNAASLSFQRTPTSIICFLKKNAQPLVMSHRAGIFLPDYCSAAPWRSLGFSRRTKPTSLRVDGVFCMSVGNNSPVRKSKMDMSMMLRSLLEVSGYSSFKLSQKKGFTSQLPKQTHSKVATQKHRPYWVSLKWNRFRTQTQQIHYINCKIVLIVLSSHWLIWLTWSHLPHFLFSPLPLSSHLSPRDKSEELKTGLAQWNNMAPIIFQ